MRLVEEKKLVRVEILILIFVVLTGIAVQFCAIKADAHNAALLNKMSEQNLTENVRISQKVSSLRYLLAAYADANVEVGIDEVNSIPHLDTALKKIVEDFDSGEISKLEYFNRLSLRHNRISISLHADYLRLQKEKEKLLQNTPVWSRIQYFIFVVQFVAISIAIFVYFLIYKSISCRAK